MTAMIEVQGLGKEYSIRHEKAGQYETLREAMVLAGKNAWQRVAHPFSENTSAAEIEAFWALRDLNFTIERGDRVGIIGANGAGKSTLLKVLSRITEPSVGRVTLHGRVASLLEVGTGFHSELSGRENIYLNGAILGMTRQEIRSKFDEIVAFAEVDRFLDTPVKRYSSGMYVRLAFAVAAHLDPEILIVDEVLAVGDAAFQRKCLGKLGEAKEDGKTVLFVSHNMQAVKQLCDRGIVLSAGEVIFDGSAGDGVEHYLKCGDSASPLAQLAEHIALVPDDPDFRYESITLTQDGEAVDHIDNSKPLEIEFLYEVFRDVKGLRVYFDLCDSEETLLFRSFHDEDNDEIPTVRRGRYRSRAVIPADLLGPTSYQIIFRSTIYNTRTLEPKNGLRALLNVESAGRYNRAYLGDTFRGKIAPSLEWKTESLP
ncbi:MAG: lipopolysaccharide transport system ATP-binding protein [Myxococcota bacterium]|jgi:lipopolysaccharide transport system ATP-binding protein